MTEMMHEHDWTDWHTAPLPSRDGILRESRWCSVWACDSTEIRPVAAAVEAAAEALCKWDNAGNGLVWADALDLTKDRYRRNAARVLAAAARALSLDWPGSPTAEVEPHTGIQAAERKSGQDDT